MKYSIFYLVFAIVLTMVSCKDSKEKLPTIVPLVNEDSPKAVVETTALKGPIINIIDTVEIKRLVLCVKDSAANMEIMNEKLSEIFKNKLPEAIKLSKIKMMGKPIVWYKSKKTPFFFEAGIPVDKSPAKLPKGMFITNTGGDSALIAHFFGPTELSFIGYETLSDVLTENNKKKTSASYEVYIDSKYLKANEKTDPYKLQTDIVMPYKKVKDNSTIIK